MTIVNIKGIGDAQFPEGMSVNDIRSFLQKKYISDLKGEYRIPLESRPNYAKPRNLSLAEKGGQAISDFLTDKGIISNNYGAQQIGSNISSLAEFLPIIGDAAAADEFGSALAGGDKVGMLLSGMAAIPMIGDAAKGIAKKVIRVTHGSSDPAFSGEITKGGPFGIFDGIFASVGDSSDYGGVKQIQYDIDEEKMMAMGDADVDYDMAIDFIKDEFPDADDDAVDLLYEIIAEDSNVFDMSVNPLEAYGYDDLGEASWEGQRLRGKMARSQGFDAVEMDDEFGTSILIPFGSKAAQVSAQQ